MADKKVVQKGDGKGQALAARIISTIAFSIMMATLVSFTVVLFVIFGGRAFTFIGMSIAKGMLFFWFFLFYILSILVLVGLFFPQTYTFWPYSFVKSQIHTSIHEISSIESVRIAITSVCWTIFIILILCFIASIVAFTFNRIAKRRHAEFNIKPAKKFAVSAFILSYFGVMILIGCLMVLTT